LRRSSLARLATDFLAGDLVVLPLLSTSVVAGDLGTARETAFCAPISLVQPLHQLARLLSATTSAISCAAREDRAERKPVDPGRHYLVGATPPVVGSAAKFVPNVRERLLVGIT